MHYRRRNNPRRCSVNTAINLKRTTILHTMLCFSIDQPSSCFSIHAYYCSRKLCLHLVSFFAAYGEASMTTLSRRRRCQPHCVLGAGRRAGGQPAESFVVANGGVSLLFWLFLQPLSPRATDFRGVWDCLPFIFSSLQGGLQVAISSRGTKEKPARARSIVEEAGTTKASSVTFFVVEWFQWCWLRPMFPPFPIIPGVVHMSPAFLYRRLNDVHHMGIHLNRFDAATKSGHTNRNDAHCQRPCFAQRTLILRKW